jgi:hypothetical protein
MKKTKEQNQQEIEEFISLIKSLSKDGNFRVGQIISNAINDRDLFYIENGDLNECLRRFEKFLI